MTVARRLLLVSPYPPPADGIGSHTRMLASALAAHADVAIAAPGTAAPSANDEVQVRRVLSAGRGAARKKLLATFRPDAIYVQFTIASYGAELLGLEHLLRLARRNGIPVTTAFHEPVREFTALPLLGRAIYRRIGTLTDAPIVHSTGAAEALASAAIGIRPVAIIPLGVPRVSMPTPRALEDFRRRYDLPGRVILALGFIHPDKGSDVLIEAMKPLLATMPDITLVIAGEPRVRSGVFRAFGQLDVRHLAALRNASAWADGRIRFPGYVAADDLPGLLAATTVIALPYRRITQSSIAHLAVAAMVPTVASRLDGLVATLGAGAAYVAPGEAAALTAALASVLADDAGRAAMRDVLADRREAWTPAAVARQIIGVSLGPDDAASR